MGPDGREADKASDSGCAEDYFRKDVYRDVKRVGRLECVIHNDLTLSYTEDMAVLTDNGVCDTHSGTQTRIGGSDGLEYHTDINHTGHGAGCEPYLRRTGRTANLEWQVGVAGTQLPQNRITGFAAVAHQFCDDSYALTLDSETDTSHTTLIVSDRRDMASVDTRVVEYVEKVALGMEDGTVKRVFKARECVIDRRRI